MACDTAIPVNKQTRERLKKFGRFHDTYDDILNRFMDQAEKTDGV